MDVGTGIVIIVGMLTASALINNISVDIRNVKIKELELKQLELKYQQSQIDQLLATPKDLRDA